MVDSKDAKGKERRKKTDNVENADEQSSVSDNRTPGERTAPGLAEAEPVGQPEKVETLKTRAADLEANVESLRDQLLRKAADFENYRKRVEAEFVTLTRFANENLIADLLPILDDFSRSLAMSKDRKEFEVFYRGIELIHSKFLKVLEAQGVKPFESVGKPFDVEYHDALMQMPREGVPPNTVIEEVEKGYKLHDKVIRHAKVIVSQEVRDDDSGDETGDVNPRHDRDDSREEL